ncbi:MAG: hypothetical protein WBA97_25505 [Actinophytocola sp.]
MSEQSVMTTPIFDELVNELAGQPPKEPVADQPGHDDDQQDDDR